MATSLKRIEKEFILSSARDDKAPIFLLAGNGEWPVEIRTIGADHMVLSHSMPLRLLRRGISYEFRFVYREQALAFRAKTREIKDSLLTIDLPASVYKNLGRRYSRRMAPSELTVAFSFKGERFELAFPTTKEYSTVTTPEPSPDFDPADIRGLIRSFNAKAEERASDRAIVMFKERKPETIEEKVITRTGKTFFLATTAGGMPEIDPFTRPRIVTRAVLADFFREEGFRDELVEDEVARFERKKRSSGILSEILVPILFQEYVIGYVSVQNRTVGQEPFDLAMFETFHLFADILAYSLKINGYFKGAPKKVPDIKAQVLDVSAGGILFANDSRELGASLLPDARLDLLFAVADRKLRAAGTVRRTYRDGDYFYYGVEYDEIQPEDFRYLFEILYGRPFTDADGFSVEGLAVKKPLIDFSEQKP
ncbi:MAG: PilZ domain-containing protein [Spirochaetota bacterium]